MDTQAGVVADYSSQETAEPLVACQWLWRWRPSLVVVEDFLGSGPRSKDIIQTIKVAGYVYYRAWEAGYDTLWQAPNQRLPGQSWAHGRARGRDAASALAHTYVQARRQCQKQNV